MPHPVSENDVTGWPQPLLICLVQRHSRKQDECEHQQLLSRTVPLRASSCGVSAPPASIDTRQRPNCRCAAYPPGLVSPATSLAEPATVPVHGQANDAPRRTRQHLHRSGKLVRPMLASLRRNRATVFEKFPKFIQRPRFPRTSPCIMSPPSSREHAKCCSVSMPRATPSERRPPQRALRRGGVTSRLPSGAFMANGVVILPIATAPLGKGPAPADRR